MATDKDSLIPFEDRPTSLAEMLAQLSQEVALVSASVRCAAKAMAATEDGGEFGNQECDDAIRLLNRCDRDLGMIEERVFHLAGDAEKGNLWLVRDALGGNPSKSGTAALLPMATA